MANGLQTLPIMLGRDGTLALVSIITFFGEIFISQSLGMEAISRSALMILMSYMSLTHSRKDRIAWALMATFGLMPAFWGQMSLR